MWAVKPRFLLIYENMLKSIATACSDCTAKHENKVDCNTDYIVPDLIDFLAIIERRWKLRLKKEIFIIVKNIVLTKDWFVVSNFWEFPKHHTAYGKIMFWQSVFPTKTKFKFTTFRTF